jgi:hypothetical protein
MKQEKEIKKKSGDHTAWLRFVTPLPTHRKNARQVFSFFSVSINGAQYKRERENSRRISRAKVVSSSSSSWVK